MNNYRSLAKSYKLYPYNIVTSLIGNKTYTRRIKIRKITLGICKAKKKQSIFK